MRPPGERGLGHSNLRWRLGTSRAVSPGCLEAGNLRLVGDRLDLDAHVRSVEADIREERPRAGPAIDVWTMFLPEFTADPPDHGPVRAVEDVVVENGDVLGLASCLDDPLEDLL